MLALAVAPLRIAPPAERLDPYDTVIELKLGPAV
jgi:hypothetical protein